MEFLRRNAFYIVCFSAGLGGVALAVTGYMAMPNVMEELKASERVYDDLSSVQSDPVNQKRIEAETRRIEQTMGDREKVFAKSKELNLYKPLVADAFPEGSDDARRRFRDEYEVAMERLYSSLGAGLTATPGEINLMKEKIENERAETQGRRGSTPSSGRMLTLAGVMTEEGARQDAQTRADVAVAQRIYCYGVHFNSANPPRRVSSVEFDPMMRDIGEVDAPAPEEVWKAQVGYWLQKDVVAAIVAVNKEAADELAGRGEAPWVGFMPVKDVISIRISDYVVEDEEIYQGALAGGENEALPCGTANTVFTHAVTTDSYDVVQFTVKLVMDQRDIPRLVNKISKNSFHTLLRLAYKSLPPNKEMHGKIYGMEPTVSVVMDFETYMLAEVSRALMPQAVCDYYDEIDCGAFKEEEDEG